MFVPCIIRRSGNTQHYALIFTTPLFYILAPTCFGSSLPSFGSFLDPSELLEIQIDWVVYYIMCDYVACVPDYRGSVCCASQRSAAGVVQISVAYFYYDISFNQNGLINIVKLYLSLCRSTANRRAGKWFN
jgi:hypothetical protein